ncbi:hypothetical protein GMRT_12649 [Giardia muris]|uniref:WD40 repeat protein n=1 Tax=Giardia muris TaxID=5742 RepID=A0A4Z1SQ88_GIAMU|nr:hypothetical protein GMRT_12649 [Giardia muris]|eukprot:TNJ27840.1 hypothetical protein GMRT_12649 [Giardia muris]
MSGRGRSLGDSALVTLDVNPASSEGVEAMGTSVQTDQVDLVDVGVGTSKQRQVGTQANISDPPLLSQTKAVPDPSELSSSSSSDLLQGLRRALTLLELDGSLNRRLTHLLLSNRKHASIDVRDAQCTIPSDAGLAFYSHGKLLLIGREIQLYTPFWPTTSPSDLTGTYTRLRTGAIPPFSSTNSVTCVTPYGGTSSRLAVGSERGTLGVLNVDYPARTCGLVIGPTELCHTDAILLIHWLRLEQAPALLTVGRDGKVLVWRYVDDTLTLRAGIMLPVKIKGTTQGSILQKACLPLAIVCASILRDSGTTVEVAVALQSGVTHELSFSLKPTIAPQFQADLLDSSKTGLKILSHYTLSSGVKRLLPFPSELLRTAINKRHQLYLRTCRFILTQDGALTLQDVSSNPPRQEQLFDAGEPLADFVIVDKNIIALAESTSVHVFELLSSRLARPVTSFTLRHERCPNATLAVATFERGVSATVVLQAMTQVRVLTVPLTPTVLADSLCIRRYAETVLSGRL